MAPEDRRPSPDRRQGAGGSESPPAGASERPPAGASERPRPAGTAALPPFEELVDRYGPSLLRFCAAQVGRERADDCFQETLLAALRGYAELRDAGAVRAWLFAIAARKGVDSHRARARAPEPSAELERLAGAGGAAAFGAGGGVAGAGAAADAAGSAGGGGLGPAGAARDPALWARVARLPAKQREALALRYLADLSHREIAAVMETSEAAARRNVFEALARLRRELGPAAEPHGSPPRRVPRT